MKFNPTKVEPLVVSRNASPESGHDFASSFKNRKVSLRATDGEISIDKLLKDNGFTKSRRHIGSGAFSRVYPVTVEGNKNAFILKQAKSCKTLDKNELSAFLLQDGNPSVAKAFFGVVSHKIDKHLEFVFSLEEFDIKSEHFDLTAVGMEYIHGEVLSKYRAKREDFGPPISEEEFIDIFIGISKGISEINEQGVIYRDLKLDNLMYDEKKRSLKLIDFSTATTLASASNTKDLGIAGTEGFRPPEVNDRKYKPSIKDDSWALASTLTNLICGKTLDEIYDEELANSRGDINNSKFSSWNDEEKREILNKIFESRELKCADRLINLLIGLSKKDPDQRLTTTDAFLELSKIQNNEVDNSNREPQQNTNIESEGIAFNDQSSIDSGYQSMPPISDQSDEYEIKFLGEDAVSEVQENIDASQDALFTEEAFSKIDLQETYVTVNEFITKNAFSKGKNIGVGEFGNVFQLKSETTDKVYALKEPGSKSKKLAKAELNALLVNHENIVKTYMGLVKNSNTGEISIVASPSDIDKLSTDHEVVAVLSEYVSGKELFDHMNDLVDEQKYVDVDTIKKMSFQVSQAISAMHKAGLLYLDLKLENVVYDEKSGALKIIDFGTTCREKDIESLKKKIHIRPANTPGSPGYVAPELANQDVSKSADVWSLGAFISMLMCWDTPGKVFAELNGEKINQDNLNWCAKFSGLAREERLKVLSLSAALNFDWGFDPEENDSYSVAEVEELSDLIQLTTDLTSLDQTERPRIDETVKSIEKLIETSQDNDDPITTFAEEGISDDVKKGFVDDSDSDPVLVKEDALTENDLVSVRNDEDVQFEDFLIEESGTSIVSNDMASSSVEINPEHLNTNFEKELGLEDEKEIIIISINGIEYDVGKILNDLSDLQLNYLDLDFDAFQEVSKVYNKILDEKMSDNFQESTLRDAEKILEIIVDGNRIQDELMSASRKEGVESVLFSDWEAPDISKKSNDSDVKLIKEREDMLDNLGLLLEEYPELSIEINFAVDQLANEYFEPKLSDTTEDLINEVFYKVANLKKEKGE
ncbi:protein kinase [uncultured Endozoicomonas sp.]|uniref:protein kinase domain-containing protein n=1 Tax=uncultured Endozoicomonas sp. TaxID=432652 RepID=UPI0026199FB9|nr:protein kinase [uncultured Endozoicomonas sp.]